MRDAEALRQRTAANLVGVHRDLQTVFLNTPVVPGYQMCATEGLRTVERQAELLAKGASKTMNSRHFGPVGHAIDFAMFDPSLPPDKDFVEEVDPAYRAQWKLFKQTADRLGVDLEWGGDWPGIKDGTHIQLSWKAYPLLAKPKTVSNSKTIAAAITGIPVTVLPEIATKVGSLTDSLDFLESKWIVVIQIVLTLGILAFIIHERRTKIMREGV